VRESRVACHRRFARARARMAKGKAKKRLARAAKEGKADKAAPDGGGHAATSFAAKAKGASVADSQGQARIPVHAVPPARPHRPRPPDPWVVPYSGHPPGLPAAPTGAWWRSRNDPWPRGACVERFDHLRPKTPRCGGVEPLLSLQRQGCVNYSQRTLPERRTSFRLRSADACAQRSVPQRWTRTI